MRYSRIALTAALLSLSTAASAQGFDPVAARTAIDAVLDREYPALDALYKDLHAHPELGFQETRTAALLAARMRKVGFAVTEHVGRTGIVAVYRNGPGPVMMVRTELDALPMEEKTGLPYASKAQQAVDGKLTFVDHACGHDIHMAWWLGTAETLVTMKDAWHGTLVFVGQPAEELVSGAKAMLDDGLFTRWPRPDYGFAAHVFPLPAGQVIVKQGVTTSATDNFAITFKGVGSHGSTPDKGIDPVVQGANFVTDVQTVISRRKDPQKYGVVTVGSFQAGTVANIIPDHAVLQMTLRSFDPAVRKLLIEGVTRTANAAASMADAPAPEIKYLFGTGEVVNDVALADKTAAILKAAIGDKTVTLVPAVVPGGNGSEDYSEFVIAGMPKSVFFGVGGYDPKTIASYAAEKKPVPVNHSPLFAPLPQPAIRRGVETLALAVLSVANDASSSTR